MNSLKINLLIALFGILSTLGMSLFLTMVRELRFANVSLVEIIGSFFYRKSNAQAYAFGWLIHLILGINFAFFYISIFRSYPELKNYIYSYFFMGISIAAIHGFIFSLVLYLFISPNHPNKNFRKIGISGALYYFIAHILYGVGFGFLCSVLNFAQHHSIAQTLLQF